MLWLNIHCHVFVLFLHLLCVLILFVIRLHGCLVNIKNSTGDVEIDSFDANNIYVILTTGNIKISYK